MPSGAKKRKAAKKKMAKGPNNNNNSSTHSNVLVNDQSMEGDDEPKQQPTERGEEEVEKQESRSPVRSIVSESNPQEEVNHDGVIDEGFVQNDTGVKSVADSRGKIATIDSEKESHDSSSSESSSSSSSDDDESRVLEMVETARPKDSNKQINYVSEVLTQESEETDAISDVEVNHSVEETATLVDADKIVILDYAVESDDGSSNDESHPLGKEKEVVDTAVLSDSNKPVDSLSETVIQVTDAILAEGVNHSVEEFGTTVESDKVVIVDNNYASDNDLEEKEVEVEVETSPHVDSNKPVNSLSEVLTQVSDTVPYEKSNHLVEETASVYASDKIVTFEHEKGSLNDDSRVLEEKTAVYKTAPPVDSVRLVDSLSKMVTEVSDAISAGEVNHLVEESASVLGLNNAYVNGSASVDNSMTSCVVVESGLKENGEKKVLSLDESAETSSVMMDLGSKNKENEIVSSSDQYAKDSAAPMNEDENSLSFIAPKVGCSNGEEHVKSEDCECSDSQPLVASAPRTVQTTSWKSCCGIFELFTGANR